MPDRMTREELIARLEQLDAHNREHGTPPAHRVCALLPDILAALRDDGWRPIETAPMDGTAILAAFQGQFHWIQFISYSNGAKTSASGYAQPTHWRPLPDAPDRAAQEPADG